MSLTVVKYRKTPSGQTIESNPTILIKNKIPLQQHITQTPQQQYIVKKPGIKVEGGSSLVINKIPAVIKPAIKRPNTSPLESQQKTKYSLQTIASTGTPLTSFQWQQTIGANSANDGTTLAIKKEELGEAISSLPPNTIIQTKTVPRTTTNNIPATILQRTPAGTTIKAITAPTTNSTATTLSALTSQGTTVQVRRPTIFIKRDSRTIRNITIEIIEKNPETHLGLSTNRLPLLKNIICATTGVAVMDCYLVLKKLRLNEDFSLLADYFEMTLEEVHHVFTKSLVRLARYLRFLIRWSDNKRYAERHKDIPLVYRQKLSNVQSLIECVDTEVSQPENSQFECNNYKFILSLTPNDIISYVSDAFVGQYDDLTIFQASNFQNVIPKYLRMVAEPGKAVRRKRKSKRQRNRTVSAANAETDSTTESADESAEEDGGLTAASENRDQQTTNSSTATTQIPSLSKQTAARITTELIPNRTLHVVNNKLKSSCVPDMSIPTARVTEPICRQQIRNMIDSLRTFKVLLPNALHEPILYQYMNEILIVVAALINLQR